MSSQEFDSVILAGKALKPAPFVSTTYEYNKSGEYIIGGFLIVTLSGTLVHKDIKKEISNIQNLQKNNDCITLKIGCSGKQDFLNGNGRIRSIDVNMSQDQPFVANYTMQIAIETIEGDLAVKPDSDFLANLCLPPNAKFLLEYSESLQVSGEASTLGAIDPQMGISKSYLKASGRITVSSVNMRICGFPAYDGVQNSIDILNSRAASLLSINACDSTNPLSRYNGWSKWLDTKSLEINTATGSAIWSFDLYLSKGGCAPFAWVDINAEDKQDQRKDPTRKTRSISGTIKGLSTSTSNLLDNKSCMNERNSNAQRAYGMIKGFLVNGTWPGDSVDLGGIIGDCPTVQKSNCTSSNQVCYQRISSSLNKSMVNGEISFSAEFADISNCDPNSSENSIEINIEESKPASRAIEIPIPYSRKAIVQVVGDTPHKATVTVRGSLRTCDPSKMASLITCVNQKFAENSRSYSGWWILKNRTSSGKYSYSRTTEYVKCG